MSISIAHINYVAHCALCLKWINLTYRILLWRCTVHIMRTGGRKK